MSSMEKPSQRVTVRTNLSKKNKVVDQSSHSCIETVEDSSVPNTESTDLYA